MKNPDRFYVYGYFEPGSDLPFYIGKGTGKRAWLHLSPTNLKKGFLFYCKLRGMLHKGIKPRIEILRESLTDQEAQELEIELIAKYGRRDLGTGCLCNHTDGGGGVSGHRMSDDARAKMSASRTGKSRSLEAIAKTAAANRGRKNTPDAVEKMKDAARKRSPESNAKIAASKRGSSMTPEGRAKLSASRRNDRGLSVQSTDPRTGESRTYTVMADVVTDGFHPCLVSKCCSGKRKTHRGLLWSYTDTTLTGR